MKKLNIKEEVSTFLNSNDNSNLLNVDYVEPYVSLLKMGINWYRLNAFCDKLTYTEILRIYNLLLSNENLIESIILTGSISRGIYSPESDVDILVILRKHRDIDQLEYVSQFREINIVYQTRQEFLNHYENSHEFSVVCVKYGMLLFDKGYFSSFYRKNINKVNKDEMIHKRTYINSIILKIYDVLANDDRDLGIKFLKKLVIQSARIIIISKDIVPMSRQEVRKQLIDIDSSFYELYIRLDELKLMNNVELTQYAETVFQFINNYLNEYYKDN